MNLNKPTDAAIRHALRGLATEISAEKPAPSATLIYLRAERRARQQAIARAILPLRIMQTLGLIVAILAAAWAIRQSLTTQDHTAAPLLKWAALALALVLAGCATLLRASRTEQRTTNN
jgi:peptidoglycan biosynthesis protein MviN/MurJ (putative lipid II flippase)